MKLLSYLNLFSSICFAAYLKPTQRIVAVGDLHGDYDQAIKVLQLAKIIDNDESWIGGANTIFVQTGDVVDRGPDTLQLFALMRRLTKEACDAGGQVINLLGNHELMNMMEDYRYVTDDDVATFGDDFHRRQTFGKDGWIGKYLRQLNLTAIVGDTVFAHGGINPKWAEVGIASINNQTRYYLQTMTVQELRKVELFKREGPSWHRHYAQDSEDIICNELNSVLKVLNANRMVMGHTVQPNGKITSRCNGRVILIDVGISSVYSSQLAALELTNEYVRALYPNGITENLPMPKMAMYGEI